MQVACCTCREQFEQVFAQCPKCEYESGSADADRREKLEALHRAVRASTYAFTKGGGIDSTLAALEPKGKSDDPATT